MGFLFRIYSEFISEAISSFSLYLLSRTTAQKDAVTIWASAIASGGTLMEYSVVSAKKLQNDFHLKKI